MPLVISLSEEDGSMLLCLAYMSCPQMSMVLILLAVLGV